MMGFRSWRRVVQPPAVLLVGAADRQFLIGIRRLTGIDASRSEWPARLDDPDLRAGGFLVHVILYGTSH